jgi:hypothetical protein
MSILSDAIKVLEKVRDLNLKIITNNNNEEDIEFPKGKNNINNFRKKLIQLQNALEEFDEKQGETNPTYTNKPDNFSYIPQTEKTNRKNTDNLLSYDPEIDNVPEDGEMKEEYKNSIKENILKVDLSYSFEDETNNELDSEGAVDSISDKLEFAIKKVGWTPRSRNLALALKNLEDRLLVIDREAKINLAVEYQEVLKQALEYIYDENQPKENFDYELNKDHENTLKYKPNID